MIWGQNMLSIRLSKDLESSLQKTSSLLNVTKSALVTEAIKSYIQDKLDYLEATNALESSQKNYSLEEVLAKFKNEL